MKKFMMLCVFGAVGAVLFAQDNSPSGRISTLVKSNLDKNYDAIQQEAADLDEIERLRIYERNKMDQWQGGLVNLLGPLVVGYIGNFGIGNFIQKDYVWGGITLGGNVVGGGMVIGGIIMLIGSPNHTSGLAVLGTGVALTVTANIAGTVRAFVYPSIYNNKLKRALNVEHMVLNIEPSVDFFGDGLSLTLATLHF